MKERRVVRESKVWGHVTHVFHSPQAAVSLLEVEAGFRCSKHFHQQRSNLFALIDGMVCIEMWEGSKRTLNLLRPGDLFTVPSMLWHRFRVLESGKMIEVYWPDHGGIVKLDDIIREDQGGPDDVNSLNKELSCQYLD